MMGVPGLALSRPEAERQSRISLKAKIPLDDQWDVIVVGGGPSGCTAAISAAREGAKTMLIEATGALGGMGTSGLLNAWCPFTDGEKIIYKGLAEKVLRASKLGTPHIPEGRYDWQPINAEHLKRVYDEMVTQAGVSVLFFSRVAAVEMKNEETVDAVIVANKNGLTAFRSKVYVDCTGDGDLAAWAGADYYFGDESGSVQAASLCFSVANIDAVNYKKAGGGLHGENKQSPIHKIYDSGKYPLVIDKHLNIKDSAPSFLMFNAGHIPEVNSTDTVQLSDAMMRGRKLAFQLHEGLKEAAPEIFNDSYLAETASVLGVRESRRIKGDYLFTIEDWLERRSFEDEIGRNCYYIDVHKKDAQRYSRYKKGESHGIPYRCLTPEKLKNVLVSGRCISSDFQSYGSLRVMPVCLVTGEAAGLAASLAVQQDHPDVHGIDIHFLRKRLREEGQYLR
jgi:hypothetical protein